MSKELLFNMYKHIRENTPSEKIEEALAKPYAKISESKLVNKQVGNKFVSTYGDWEFTHGEDVESIEDIDWGYSDGEEPNNLLKSLNDFIGLNFHLMQQVGGKLTYKGTVVNALKMEDTAGNTVQPDLKVRYGRKIVTLGELGVQKVEEVEEAKEQKHDCPNCGDESTDGGNCSACKEAEKKNKKEVVEATGDEKVLASFSDEQAAKDLASQKQGYTTFDDKNKLWKVIVKESKKVVKENIEVVVSEEGDPKAVIDVNTETGEITATSLEAEEQGAQVGDVVPAEAVVEEQPSEEPKEITPGVAESKLNESKEILKDTLDLLSKAYDSINEPVEGSNLWARNQLVNLCSAIAQDIQPQNPRPIEQTSEISGVDYFEVIRRLYKAFALFNKVETEEDKALVNDIILLCQNIDADAERMDESKKVLEGKIEDYLKIIRSHTSDSKYVKIPRNAVYVRIYESGYDSGSVEFYTEKELAIEAGMLSETNESKKINEKASINGEGVNVIEALEAISRLIAAVEAKSSGSYMAAALLNAKNALKDLKNDVSVDESKEKIEESQDDFTYGYGLALQKSLKDVLGVSIDFEKIANKLKSLQREELETLKQAMEMADLQALKHFLNSIL